MAEEGKAVPKVADSNDTASKDADVTMKSPEPSGADEGTEELKGRDEEAGGRFSPALF